MNKPKISVVVPAKNEESNLPILISGILDAFAAADLAVEIIIVNDGSNDGTLARLQKLQKEVPTLRILDHVRSGGQSAAVHSGACAARGKYVCTLDGDGQNPPSELPKLVAPFLADNAPEMLGLVAGQRVKRQDTLSKKLASKAANGIRSFILKDKTRDTGCGLKAFRRDAFIELPYFDHMHRYLPALFTMNGYEVDHVDVSHQARHSGQSNYSNLQRGLVGAVDLLGVAWLIRRRKKARATEISGDL
ncbi:glycosyltransferase family 2 protein [Pseudopelagicola sp. nBUS_19]|uniref:glycosyltransferase family 2 protein n=1 Tax=unclassified Pseudopelagicola TaxID=2649563 RepID=UPI003EB841BE